ncbi:hypothetical protein KI688_005204 [Linnemannia hyalina]|uniref:Uncharacterized protein n=1 Tax=Linnemannia hyalina TaxID=64524 RepID=A0A9P7XNQ2_9FUNG|nr:hypothetical protein KI688_005203 [Linnemannia hyalina]KAG9062897.1 hypothetical protein KI688_005204 [Linnemannia hyalina]
MASSLDWATAVHVVDGQQQEHVSFPSFVKEFGIRDMDDATSSYKELLESPRIKSNRRERLKADFADFVRRRLPVFWSQWEKGVEMETMQLELEHSAAIVAKKTAVVASLQDSSMLSGILQAQQISRDASHSTKVPATTIHPGNESDSATDLYIAESSRAKATPFYELIAFVFKKAKGKPATLPHAVPRGLSKNHEELYRAALARLRASGSCCYPVIAEGQGRVLDFYTIRRYEDVLGAGWSAEKCVALPPQVGQLKSFLMSDNLLTLIAFKEHMRKFAIDVTDALGMSPRSHVAPDGDRELLSASFDSSTPSSVLHPRRDSSPSDPAPSFLHPRRDSSPSDPAPYVLSARPCAPLSGPARLPAHRVRSSTPPRRKRLKPFVVFSPSKKDKLNGGGAAGDHAGSYDNDDDTDK